MKGKIIFLLLFLCVSMFALAEAESTPTDINNTPPIVLKSSFFHFSVKRIESHMEGMETTIDLNFNGAVRKRIKRLVTRGKVGMEHFLGRSVQFFPIIERKLSAAEMPDELKYLAVIESGLKPTVKSGKGAGGLWQLMPGTARDYGLVINEEVDERFDLNKSTEASLLFLQDLYQDFGDWTLAIAAYNCGPVRVRQAINRRKSKDFWKIKVLLPKQTQAYVEKFTAITYLMSSYHFYNLRPRYPDYNLQMTQTIQVYSRKTFFQLAQETGIPVAILKTLNPSYLNQVIPARASGCNLILPVLGLNAGFIPERMQFLGQR